MFRPRCSTKMHHVPGLSAASLQILFARLNDCSSWDEVDVTFVQTRKSRKVPINTRQKKGLYTTNLISKESVGVGEHGGTICG